MTPGLNRSLASRAAARSPGSSSSLARISRYARSRERGSPERNSARWKSSDGRCAEVVCPTAKLKPALNLEIRSRCLHQTSESGTTHYLRVECFLDLQQ